MIRWRGWSGFVVDDIVGVGVCVAASKKREDGV